MKKKLFRFIFVFAFILIGVICLNACGGDEKGFSELIVEVNGRDYQYSYDFGDFECGTTPNINYTVYAKYTDGSKTEFNNSKYSTEYRLNGQAIESLPETYGASHIGSYYIGISYEHFTFQISFNIVYASTTYQTEPLSKTIWSYGEEQPELSLVDKTIELDQNCYKYIKQSDVANPNSLTSEEINKSDLYHKDNPLAPGDYYLFIMVPQTGIYAETPSTLRPVKVNKMQLVATHSKPLKVTYDYRNIWSDGGYRVGNFQIKDLNTNGLFDEIQTKNGELVQIANWSLANPDTELNSTNSGDQLTCNFAFYDYDEKMAEYYILPNPVSVTLEVIKGQFEKPTIREYNDPFDAQNPDKIDVYIGKENESTNNYNWSFYVLTVTKPDGSTETIDISAINPENWTHIYLDRPTEKGTYTYTVKLKETTNYTWNDGTTNEVSYSITIE